MNYRPTTSKIVASIVVSLLFSIVTVFYIALGFFSYQIGNAAQIKWTLVFISLVLSFVITYLITSLGSGSLVRKTSYVIISILILIVWLSIFVPFAITKL